MTAKVLVNNELIVRMLPIKLHFYSAGIRDSGFNLDQRIEITDADFLF